MSNCGQVIGHVDSMYHLYGVMRMMLHLCCLAPQSLGIFMKNKNKNPNRGIFYKIPDQYLATLDSTSALFSGPI